MTYQEILDQYQRVQTENEQLQERVAHYQQRLEEAQRLIRFLRRQMFGRKSERFTSNQQEQINQLELDLDQQVARPAPLIEQVLQEQGKQSKRGSRCGHRGLRHPIPEQLETETVVIEPPVSPCPCCGSMPGRIGEEVTEEIDLIPAKVICRRTVRPKYACRCGGAGVAIARLPARLIPQSRLGLGLAVHVLLSRFDDHLSYYWIEKQFMERHGVEIARQQMVQWVEQIAVWLKPIYEAMWNKMHAGGYLQVDETPVKVLDPEIKGKAARGYLWFYAVPGADVILVFDRRRGLAAAAERLKDFSGTIQTDAYEVYQSLKRQQSDLERIGCLAHSRRRFYAALLEGSTQAVWFISRIALLYGIEEESRKLQPQERRNLRLQQAPAIWEELKTRAQELKPTLLPKSTLGKAISYFLNDHQALIGYLQDGRFEIDNNLVENAIRPMAVGRKRWLFIGHPNAGWRSAVIYSILASCRRRSINPRDYLTDVLRRLPETNINQIDSLLPANWKPQTIPSA